MAPQYGEVRVDYITYTTGVVPNEGNATAYVSGLINNPTFSGNVIIEGDATIDGNLNVSGAINASGVVISGITGLFDAGTEALPSIAFTLDPNTGIYNPSANAVGISTGGAEAVRIDSTGNVGIGASSPQAKLDVNSDSTDGIYAIIRGNKNELGNTSQRRLKFFNPEFRMAIQAQQGATTVTDSDLLINPTGGNVGIGTTNPLNPLHVSSSGGASLRLQDSGGTAGVNSALITADGTTALKLQASAGTTAKAIIFFRSNTEEAMRIDTNGNVGIGTSTPQGALHVTSSNLYSYFQTNTDGQLPTDTVQGLAIGWNKVAGSRHVNFICNSNQAGITGSGGFQFSTQTTDGTFQDQVLINGEGKVGIGTTNPQAKLEVYGDGRFKATDGSHGIELYSDVGGGGYQRIISYNRTSSAYEDLSIGVNNFIVTNGASSEALRVDSSGNVGIGTSTPQATLDVNGDVLINTLTVGLGGSSVSTNTALGRSALYSNTTGSSNTAVGHNALYSNTTGDNTAVGRSALFTNTTGDNNTAIGRDALYYNTTGDNNTAIGRDALYYNTEGGYNTAIGRSALYSNTTGADNTALGQYALYSNTTGTYNTAIGRSTLFTNTTGDNNTALGRSALYSNTTGDNNTALGQYALYSNTTGTYNTALGRGTLFTNTEGTNNTAVGLNAGYYIEGDSNTILGAYQGTSADATLSNTVIISAGATERLRIDSLGRVGIGTPSPNAELHIAKTGASDEPTLRIQSENSSIYLRTAGSSGLFPTGGGPNDGELLYLGGDFRVGIGTASKNLIFMNGSGYAERARIDSSGRVGIGTTSPSNLLDVASAVGDGIRIGSSPAGLITRETEGLRITGSSTNKNISFVTAGSEACRIDTSGRLLVGTSSSSGQNATLQVVGSECAQFHKGSADTAPATLNFSKSRNTSYGSFTSVQADDRLGSIAFRGDDGTDYLTRAAEIVAFVDGTPGANDMPGRLVFSTTADGASSPTERMRLNSSGQLLLGATSAPNSETFAVTGSAAIEGLNGNAVIDVDQDETATVTYNLRSRETGMMVITYAPSSTQTNWGTNGDGLYMSIYFGNLANARANAVTHDTGRTLTLRDGAISVSSSGNSIIISKTAGSSSNNGDLSIAVISAHQIRQPTAVVT